MGVLTSNHYSWMLQRKAGKKPMTHWTVGTEGEFIDML